MTRKLKITLAALAAVIAAAAAVLAVLALGGSTAKPLTVHGAMELSENCAQAAFDYPDISSGAQVVITDPAGKVIAVTSLGAKDAVLTQNGGVGICRYPFMVTVGARARYGITIAQRGTVWFTAAEMRKGPALSLSPPSNP